MYKNVVIRMNWVLVEKAKVIVIATLNVEEALYVEVIIVIADIFHRVIQIAAKKQVSSSTIFSYCTCNTNTYRSKKIRKTIGYFDMYFIFCIGI